MIINVTSISLPPFSTIGTASGVEEESGDLVTFGVDHGNAAVIADALDQDLDVTCEIEGWQVLSMGPAFTYTGGSL